jgi:hypothetical protein
MQINNIGGTYKGHKGTVVGLTTCKVRVEIPGKGEKTLSKKSVCLSINDAVRGSRKATAGLIRPLESHLMVGLPITTLL